MFARLQRALCTGELRKERALSHLWLCLYRIILNILSFFIIFSVLIIVIVVYISWSLRPLTVVQRSTPLSQFECCGAVGPEDYVHSAWYNRTKTPKDKPRVPLSCCYQTKSKPSDDPLKKDRGVGGEGDCQIEVWKFFSNPVQYRQTESSTALKTQVRINII